GAPRLPGSFRRPQIAVRKPRRRSVKVSVLARMELDLLGRDLDVLNAVRPADCHYVVVHFASNRSHTPSGTIGSSPGLPLARVQAPGGRNITHLAQRFIA